jgi:hypothetical protein
MKRIASALTLVTLNLAASIERGEEALQCLTHVEALQPFTQVARIPADSDTDSIRFQKAKMVQVPTTISYTTNPEYCEEIAVRDPGGSMYCSSARTGTPATAYELTFSFVGPPLASMSTEPGTSPSRFIFGRTSWRRTCVRRSPTGSGAIAMPPASSR